MAAEPVREGVPAPPEATPAACLPAMVGKVRNTTIGPCRHDLDCSLPRCHPSLVQRAVLYVSPPRWYSWQQSLW